MGQFAGQHEWLTKLSQDVQHVRLRWLQRQTTTAEPNGSHPRLGERHIEHLQADRTPVVGEELRDEELLVLIGQGDAQALGALYDRHGPLVFSIALRITGTRCDAEAVTEDVFERVWQHARGFQGAIGLTSGWIVGVARVSALEKLRAGKGIVQPHTTSRMSTVSPIIQVGVQLKEAARFRDDMRAALAVLPVDQRQALDLAYYGGLSTCEIAEALDTSQGVVKTRLRLGLMKLRDVLQSRVSADEHDQC